MRLGKLTICLAAAAMLSTAAAWAQEEAQKSVAEYLHEVRRSVVNPHDQINDEGDVMWDKCLVCHKSVPDVDKPKSIEESDLRYKDDLKQMCWQCHPKRVHPGAEQLTVIAAAKVPNHLIVPPRDKQLNMRMSSKEHSIRLPLEPGTGKIFCATCHNPHERGLVQGKMDRGADQRHRLRSAGTDICQYCHRK